ncbi:MFS transporter [Amycolatopsis anabasis]|uniref:MFS transporter n=1 Tax=Amycolatopsis anabasis TaxID=1840409 RepID=UPI001C550F2B|nr:MFS transporter [Amycolatopsis anabasis]
MPETRTRQGPPTALMCLCVVLVVSMVAAINLAIPSLSADALHPSHSTLVWVVDAYVIVFACLLIPAGALGDRLGRKGALLTGLAVFAAGALLSGVAPNIPLLLAGRVLSGLGAAAVMPATLAILIGTADESARPKAIAVWASATGVAGTVGNLGGGALLQTGSWRALFLTVAPIAVVVLGLVALFTPRLPGHPRPVEPVSALLFTGGVVALLIGITLGPSAGWASATVLTGFAAAVVLLTGWAAYELRAEHPMLDPRLFRVRTLRANSFAMAAAFLGMFGLFYVNGQYLQTVKGFSPFLAGVGVLPVAIPLLVLPRLIVRLAARLGGPRVTAAGLALLAAGLVCVSTVDSATGYGWYAAGTLVVACGCALVMPTASAGIMAALPHSRAGLGSGLQGMTRELGSALGVAIVGTILGTGEFGAVLGTAMLTLAGVVAAAALYLVRGVIAGGGS